MPFVPLFIVRQSGQVDELGGVDVDAQRLSLTQPGFPLLSVGEHDFPGELPWVFWEMAPQGFLGRQFADAFPELGLGPEPSRWSARDVLIALSRRGEDLPGNLVVGEESRRRLDERRAALPLEDVGTVAVRGVRRAFDAGGGPACVGGERPKFVTDVEGAACVCKFSPPVQTAVGRRWADLLTAEALCAEVFERFVSERFDAVLERRLGVLSGQRAANAAVGARMRALTVGAEDDRVVLEVLRYDRVEHGRGRVGAATLATFAATASEHSARAVVTQLYAQGQLAEDDLRLFERAERFSRAIGNTDRHPGNTGLVFDEEGRALLAPQYDVLPMVFAPEGDELPDRFVEPPARAPDPSVGPLLALLIDALEEAPLSAAFREAWLAWLGRRPSDV